MNYLPFILHVSLFAFPLFFTPGPNNATVMAVGLSRGFRAALPHVLAVTVSAPVFIFLCGLGLGEVFTRYPIINEILRYVGAVYMLWLAWKISGIRLNKNGLNRSGPNKSGQQKQDGPLEKALRQSRAKPGSSTLKAAEATAENPARHAAEAITGAPAEQNSRHRKNPGLKPMNFWQALLFQLVNPKAWITNIAVLTMFAGGGAEYFTRLGIICAIFCVQAFGATALWAAGGAMMNRFLSSEGIRYCNYVFAAFLLLSIVLLFI